jgi:two-component system LytT family response regulator
VRPDHFFVRVKGVYRKVALDSIVYLQAGYNEVEIVLSKGSLVVRGSLTKVVEMLPAELFCRVHESYAVCVAKIILFNSESVVVQSGKNQLELPMGKYHKKMLEEKIWVLGEKVVVTKDKKR